MLARVLELRLEPASASAWIEYPRRMPLTRLKDAIDWALASTALDPAWAAANGRPPHPSFRFDCGAPASGRATDPPDADLVSPDRQGARRPASPAASPSLASRAAPTRLASNPSPAWPKLAGSPTSRLLLWLTRDEREVLGRAIVAVRRARGRDMPLWACIDELLNHFTGAYEDPAYARLSRRSPVLLRDDRQCQAPGDFHHLAIHRGWIGCWGAAPDRIRWSFGVKRRRPWLADSPHTLRLSQARSAHREHDAHLSQAHGAHREHDAHRKGGAHRAPDEPDPWVRPIAEFVGHQRLRNGESFPVVERRLFGEVTQARAGERRGGRGRAGAGDGPSLEHSSVVGRSARPRGSARRAVPFVRSSAAGLGAS